MTAKTWTLLDPDQPTATDEFIVPAGELGGRARRCAARMRRLRGGLRDGVDVVEIDNGALRFTVLPTRGMGIWKAWLGDLELGWRSPVRGPVHPKFVPIFDPSGLGWLDGFDELVCRCGLESNGAPDFDEQGRVKYPLHGRIANRPAHQLALAIDEERGEIRLTGQVDESRFHFQKLRLTSTLRTTAGQPMLEIEDTITNISGNAAEAQLLYHINIGQPLLDPGSTLVAPAKRIAPRDEKAAKHLNAWQTYGNEQPGSDEQVYFLQLAADRQGKSEILLKNAHAAQGVGLRFDIAQLPYFIVWKNTPAAADGYVTGLEPATNFPNPRTFETQKGRILKLEPGQSAHFKLAIEIYPNANAVAQAERRVKQLQAETKPQISESPDADWSPASS